MVDFIDVHRYLPSSKDIDQLEEPYS